MQGARRYMHLLFAVIPVVCLGRDTNINTRVKQYTRTDASNHSDYFLGNYNTLNIKENYLDLISRFIQSYQNSQMPLMRRPLRSFKDKAALLTSIKREAETLENLENLQYYGYEIPKKYTPDQFITHHANLHDNDNNEVNDAHAPRGNQIQSAANAHVLADRFTIPDTTVADSNEIPVNNIVSGINNVGLLPDMLAVADSQALSGKLLSYDRAQGHVISKKRIGGFPPSRNNSPEPEVCNMDDIEINISFRETRYTEAGEFLLICTGTETVKKCEGACNSQVKPSVNNYDGFQRVSCKLIIIIMNEIFWRNLFAAAILES